MGELHHTESWPQPGNSTTLPSYLGGGESPRALEHSRKRTSLGIRQTQTCTRLSVTWNRLLNVSKLGRVSTSWAFWQIHDIACDMWYCIIPDYFSLSQKPTIDTAPIAIVIILLVCIFTSFTVIVVAVYIPHQTTKSMRAQTIAALLTYILEPST